MGRISTDSRRREPPRLCPRSGLRSARARAHLARPAIERHRTGGAALAESARILPPSHEPTRLRAAGVESIGVASSRGMARLRSGLGSRSDRSTPTGVRSAPYRGDCARESGSGRTSRRALHRARLGAGVDGRRLRALPRASIRESACWIGGVLRHRPGGG